MLKVAVTRVAVVFRGSCPRCQLSWVVIVQVGSCPGGSYLVAVAIKLIAKYLVFIVTFVIHKKQTLHMQKTNTLTTKISITEVSNRTQWHTQKIFMGGVHSTAYGGHLYLVYAVCDVTI